MCSEGQKVIPLHTHDTSLLPKNTKNTKNQKPKTKKNKKTKKQKTFFINYLLGLNTKNQQKKLK